MRHILKNFLLLVMITAGVISTKAFAQQSYEISGKPEMKVSGTSTLHDWDMVSSKAEGTASLRISAGKVTSISSARFSMPVASLKSGKGQMDNNAYKALKESDHPNISFTLLEANQDGGNDWKATGRLQIAGETRTVPFQLSVSPDGNEIRVNGSAQIKLTDFEVDPPTAVFGTIKTGDEMTITIDLNLNPVN
ncbi:YceI family protein [Cyclobacterium sp.]|uniref:YceI family protein n=1 Tax=Cyclobacterium sp. TaxID=1966343 RepID=UPI00199EE541|nr:YceI family protein [Cyclobacterium sp.]MBD3629644.1 YceI family protein [Cyclobacterium sp.]